MSAPDEHIERPDPEGARRTPARADVADRVAWVLATWFGCGKAPVAPGTAGSLGALPVYLLAVRGGRGGVWAAALLATGIGIWAAGRVARTLGAKDPQVVVIDEVAGMLLTMVAFERLSWVALAVGFACFRILDALKPGPIRAFERLPGGWGIVMDDVAAGALGAALLAAAHGFGAL